MGNHLLLLLLLLLTIVVSIHAFMRSVSADELIFNGFSGTNLKLNGQASITGHAIRLTHGVTHGVTLTEGDAFYSKPLNFSSERISSGGGGASFSTTFVFAVTSDATESLWGTHGMAFVLSSTMELHSDSSGQYLGFPNIGSNSSNSGDQFFFAIELNDIDSNHVGINVESLVSVDSHTTSFYRSNSRFQSTELSSGKPMQVWVDYDSREHKLNVTFEEFVEFQFSEPRRPPQLSSTVNLSSLLSNSDFVYAGFSAATGQNNCSHYVLGWSFIENGEAPPLNYFTLNQILANLPVQNQHENHISEDMNIPRNVLLPIVTLVPIALVFVVVLVSFDVKSWLKETLGHEKWEIECGLPSFTYKDIVSATSGFNKKALLGKGGFGRVYKGVLAVSKQTIAIKRVSPESKQGMKEFMAEITILGRLRHRNLVQLIGYCRHRQELLLVYDYMPNGSLDTYLHNRDKPTLDWAQRLRTIKGVTSGLLYLHEDWECVVIHRDIKASNVLLDDEMNARLGDFGLARLHDHEANAHTTRVAGTWGYIAPELARLGKATKVTDVYAFGIFMLEVACGRRPIEVNPHGEPLVLADWVLNTWQNGSIVDCIDTRLEEDHVTEEVQLVLKLGLLCSHSLPKKRPCMRLVMQYLEGDVPFPDFPPSFLSVDASKDEGYDEQVVPCPSVATSITGLSGGR